MKKIALALLILLPVIAGIAQPASTRVFWSEDFSKGALPSGWKAEMLNDSSINWIVTDQPFPGSWGRSSQAPPIASSSRGFHLQYSPGKRTDKYYRAWNRAGKYPDAYIQTPSIDCSKKNSVVLTFQQNFFWNDRLLSGNAGLYVGVSNDGVKWTEYDVRQGIPAWEDCPNPMSVELNITKTAARQRNVYLRFYWRGIYHWYWMVDDIALSEGFEADIEAHGLTSHRETGNTFTGNDAITFQIVNLSAKPITSSFDCFLRIDKREPLKYTVNATPKKPFGIIDTLTVRYEGINLSDYGLHRLQFNTSLADDQRKSNDTLTTTLYSGSYELGNISKYGVTNDGYEFECGNAKLKLQFVRNDIFRIQMSYNGEFVDPVGNDIVINPPKEKPQVHSTENSEYYLFKTSEVALRVYRNPIRFALYKPDNTSVVWEEAKGLTYGYETVQYMKRGPNEQFYGGGMQNGRFAHRDKTIHLTIDYNWEDGGNPNPAPFFMSSNGWGALRNTYAPGSYSFTDTVKLRHSEPRFDCYYFTGNSLKDILGDYTDITGKPFLMPRWALSMGDANCYNRGAKANIKTVGSNSTGYDGLTPSVINIIVDKYIEHRMPRGWILPNDGYGCGYTSLDSVVRELYKRGFYTGLWTENGVERIAREVGELGSRLCKLDVAWVGPGYKFALDGAKAAYEGIENNCDARGFVWMVCGWAGSHRNAVLWTGDQSGSWNYIRWHIPTLIGSGLSAQNCATGDVDGIFGGSDSTYTRDLQWKCFTPVFMAMSGWASNNKNGITDKQPWLFGEPFTSINRKYLMLKQRLTPYMYTLCAEANRAGIPAVRGLMLEYPSDPETWGEKYKYQYLLGKDLLVAPVYKSESKRDSVYLPEGTWYDYWDGTEFKGKTTLMGYNAPLDRLPLFVRAGAIIPMYNQLMYDWERPTDTVTLDIFPNGKSSFAMYEDDGLTREHRQGVFATTLFEVDASRPGFIDIALNKARGYFKGRLRERTYVLNILGKTEPKQVMINGRKIKKLKVLNGKPGDAVSGYYFDSCARGGTIKVITPRLLTDEQTSISLKW